MTGGNGEVCHLLPFEAIIHSRRGYQLHLFPGSLNLGIEFVEIIWSITMVNDGENTAKLSLFFMANSSRLTMIHHMMTIILSHFQHEPLVIANQDLGGTFIRG